MATVKIAVVCYSMCMSAHIRKEPSDEHVVIASDIFKLASDPTRLKILWALLHGEHSVGELAEDIKAQPTAVSQHLSKLRAAHIVSVRRDGTKMFYRAENEHVRTMIEQAFSQAGHIADDGMHD